MEKQYTNLGKVCLTPAGVWSIDKEFERLDIVNDAINNKSYVAKKDVPVGINISNTEYWQNISGGGYKDNNIIILSDVDNEGNIKVYSLLDAINSIDEINRRPGLVLGFYGVSYDDKGAEHNDWYLYQFNSNTIDDWNDLEKWSNIYYNTDKFKGFFTSEEELLSKIPNPIVGDFSYGGASMEEAVIYVCKETGVWTNTNIPAYNFANKYEAVFSKDYEDFEDKIDEVYANRAEKDSLGNVIHFTYATKEGISTIVLDKVRELITTIELPTNCIKLDNLSDEVKQYIGSSGNIVNYPDGEDLTVKKVNDVDVIKFANKDYDPINFSGLGKVYLRKNMTDGINVLEQYMINKPNTIYIIQYDYCLNGAIIDIPENSTLRFDGGSLNGGSINLNNTKLENIISLEDIGTAEINNNSTFRIGQMVYDTSFNLPVWWNGYSWSFADGGSTEEN